MNTSDMRRSRHSLILVLLAAALGLRERAAHAAPATWSGAVDNQWALGGNWSTTPVPGTGDTATFNSAGGAVDTLDLGGGVTVAGLVFDLAPCAAYTLGSGGVGNQSLTLGDSGAITIQAAVANSQAINAAVTIGSAAGAVPVTLTDNSGGGATLTVAGNITGGGSNTKTLTVAGPANTILSGAIANGTATVAVTMNGSGTLILSGPNTYTGATAISAGGAVNIRNTNALGGQGTATTVANTGALQIQGNIFTIKEPLTLNGAGVSSDGALRNISGANVYNGAVTLASASRINSDSGILMFQNPDAAIVTGGFTLTVGGAGDTSVLVGISGTGGVTKDGAGTFGVFGVAPVYTGTSTVNGGSILLGVGETANTSGPLGKQLATAAGTIVFGGGALKYSPQNNYDYSGRFATTGSQPIKIDTYSRDVTFATAIQGAGTSLAKLGAGTLTLSNAGNSYTGATTLNGGTLFLSGAGVVPGTGTVTVNGGGNLSTADGTARNTTLGGLVLGNAALVTLDWNGGAVDTLATAAAATASGNVGITLNTAGSPSGSGLTLISAGSGLSGATYYLANNAAYTAALSPSDTAVTVGSYASATALTSIYWTGSKLAGAVNAMALSDGTAGNWSTTQGSYTATGLVPGPTANVTFSAAGATQQANIVLGANMSVNSVTFSDTTPVTIAGDGCHLTLNSTGTGASSAVSVNQDATVNANLILPGAQVITAAAGKTLTIGGNIAGAGAGTGSLTFTGAGSGSNSGTLTLTGASTYGGATTVNGGGTLNYGAGSTKPYLSTAAFTIGPGAVNVVGFVDLNRFDVNNNGAINVNGGTLITRQAKANGGQAKVGSGSYGALTVASGGAINISGNLGGNGQEDGRIDIGESGTGLLRVTGGTLSVGNGLYLSGNGGAGNAELTITGGTLNHGGNNRVNEGWFYVATRGGLTVVNVAGGLIDNNQNQVVIAQAAGTAGSNTGIVNLNAGVFLTREFTQATANNGNMAILNFNGGTLTVGAGSSATAFTPTPASLAANASFTTFVNGPFGAFSGGAVIDTFGNSTTIPSSLLAPTGNGVTAIAVPGGGAGSGYVGAPFVTITDSGAVVTGSTAGGSNVITGIGAGDIANLFVGQTITGTGIPAGAIVTAVGATTATMSQNATGANAGLTVRGCGATAYATLSGGAVDGYVVTNPGVGYVGTVTATLTGGYVTGGTAATNPTGANITTSANTSGGLTKNGMGTLTLSGANTFTGTVTVNAGTVAFGQAGTVTYSAVAGAGAVTQSGTGTTIVNGPSTYTGVTTITAGVLQLNGAAALPGGIGATGGTSALTFNGGVLGLGFNDFTRDLAAAGTVTAANFAGTGGWAAYGADRVVNVGGALRQIVWTTANTGFNNTILYLSAPSATHMVDLQNPLELSGATKTVYVYDGAAAIDAQFSGVLTSSGGGPTKTGPGTLSISNSGNSYTGTTFVNAGTLLIVGAGKLGSGAALTLGGGTLDLGGTSQAVGAVSITTAAASGDTIRNGSLTGASYAASLTAGNAVVSAGLLLNGAAGFAKSGAGTVTLSGNNTYNGGTSVTAGTLVFASPSAIGGSARDVTVTSPGAVVFGPSFGSANLAAAMSRVVTTSTGFIGADNYADANFDFDAAGLTSASLGSVGAYVPYAGTLTPQGTTYRLGGGGGLLYLGAVNALTGAGRSLNVSGNVILAAANDYGGGTVLTSGTLYIGADNALGTGSLTFAGGTIAGTDSAARTLANPIILAGNVSIGGTADMTFSDTGSAALGSTRTFTVNSGVTTFAQVFTGGAGVGLTKAGAGVLALTGANTYIGTTTINAGTLRANDNAGLPGTASSGGGSYLNIAAGALETGANFERAGGTGQGQMQITAGTSGFSAYGAPVQVAFGTLAAPTALTWAVAPFQPGTFVLNAPTANNTIDFKNAISLVNAARTIEVDANVATISGTVSSTGTSGTLTKTGVGSLVLTAAAYTGTTTVNAGTLTIRAPASTLTAGLTLGSSSYGGAFVYDNVGASGASSMTLASLTAANQLAADNTVQITRTAAQNVTLTFSAVSVNTTENGNVINFVTSDVAGGGVNGTNYKIVLGGGLSALIGAGASSYYNITSQNAYFNGSDFAVYDPAGFVRGINYVSDSGAATSSGATFTATLNQEMTGHVTGQGTYSLGSGAGLGTLKINGPYNLTMTAGSTLTFNAGGNVGVHGLLKTGGGTAVISGGTAVNLGSTQGDVRVDGATEVLNISMPVTWAGTTRLMKSGAGTLIISAGTLQFTDTRNTLYVNGGVCEIGGTATYNGTVANTMLVANGALFRYNSSSVASVRSGVINGAGGVTVSAGTLTLSGGNGFAGQLTVDGGTLAIPTINNVSASGTLGQSALSVILGKSGSGTGTLEYTGATAGSTKPFTLATDGTGAFQVDSASTVLTLSGVINGGGGLSKTGAGTLALTGVNTYTGATSVQAGILSLANPCLADAADVSLSGSGVLDLNFVGTDTIRALYFDGVDQATGTWGSPTSAAAHKSAKFTGTGLLNITSTSNLAPVITSDGGGVSASVNADENQTAVTTVTAVDNESDPITFSLNGGADVAFFAIDPDTGVLTFLAAPDYEAPADADANNIYAVTVRATAGTGTDDQAISVNVQNVNEPPIITSDGGGATAALNATENGTAVTTVTSTDPESDARTYSIAGGADAGRFTIDPDTGVLAFSPAPDFEYPADVGADNAYEVIVQAAATGGTDSQTITVTVLDVNEPPAITSNGGGATAGINVNENSTAVATVAATDPENDARTYSIIGGADMGKFSIVPGTGALTFNTAPNFEAPTDVGADNTYEVIVQAASTGGTDSQTITVTVQNVNEASGITSNGGGPTAAVGVNENATAVATVSATDPEGDPVTYSISGGADAAKFTIDLNSGVLTFVSAPNFEHPSDVGSNNTYEVTVQASSTGGTGEQAITVTVSDVAESPLMMAAANVQVGQTLVGIVKAHDEDAGEVLHYAIAGGADQLRFQITDVTNTGRLEFVDPAVFNGSANGTSVYYVEVTVTDSTARTDRMRVEVTVVNSAATTGTILLFN